jgi:hypothetical protein
MSGAATALASEIEPEPIDWEAVFEADGHGLILLIGEPKSFAALKGCMLVFVEQLFSRDGDEAIRDSYIAELEQVFSDDLDGRGDDPKTLKKLIALMTLSLREIKTYRIKKAEEFRRAALTGSAEPLSGAERRSEAGEDAAMLMDAAGAADIGENNGEEAPATDRAETEKIFGKLIAAEYKNRFKALQMGISQKALGKTRLPFFLSAEFAEKFDEVLSQYLIPEFTQHCHEIVTRATTRAADKQKSYFQQFTGFEGGHGEIWEHWRQTWTDVTTKQKLPTRPTGKSKTKKERHVRPILEKGFGRRRRSGRGRAGPLEGQDHPTGKDQRLRRCRMGNSLCASGQQFAAGTGYRWQALDGPLWAQHQEPHEIGACDQPDRQPGRGNGARLRGSTNRQGYRDLPLGGLFPKTRSVSRAQANPQTTAGRFSRRPFSAHSPLPAPAHPGIIPKLYQAAGYGPYPAVPWLRFLLGDWR